VGSAIEKMFLFGLKPQFYFLFFWNPEKIDKIGAAAVVIK
jgi:hypothetical protein